jgi:predicted transposase/invertase (TIGR01784 family)
VELQKAKQNFFKDRSVSYATFPIREQAERGDKWNFELAAVYCIGILDFVFDEDRDNPDYLHTVQLKNQRNAVFYDKLTFVYLEMPKFHKTEAELGSQTDKWLYFIKYLSGLEEIPVPLHEEIFERAFQTAEIAQFNPAQVLAYENSLKYYRDLQNVMDTAIEEAEERGRTEDIEQGLQQGLQQGLEEGERRKQIEIARSLKQMGLSPSDIAKATGLSVTDIELLNGNNF